MTQELKPCPFCGSGEVRAISTMDDMPGEEELHGNVICLNCLAYGPTVSIEPSGATDDIDAVEEMARRAWNKRHEAP